MRQLVATLAIAAALASPALAQGTAAAPVTPATPPPAQPAAEKPASVGAAFTDADRSADAIKRADAILADAAKAYAAVSSLSEKVTIGMAMPDGENKETMVVEYGPKNAFRMSSSGATLIAVDGIAYFLPDQPADKYVEKKVENGVGKTFADMLPGFAMPTVALALRDGLKGEDLIKEIGGLFLQGPKVAGARTADGHDEILLTGEGGDVVVVFDPKTKLQSGMRASISPAGAPPGFSLALNATVENTLSEKLEKPIAFEKGNRTAVKSVMDLMDSAEPEMKVKVGDVAPISPLQTLDGKTVDLASMKGKVVVIDFWATWCGPCRKGLPLLQKFADSMKDNDKVVVQPVNVWERMAPADRSKAVGEFWTAQKFTMTTLLDPDNKFIDAYGFSGIPAFVVIGPDGKLAATHIGYDEKLVETLTEEVKKALEAK